MKMKPSCFCLSLCLSLLPLSAGELDPRLAPMAATYQKQVADLTSRADVDREKAVQVFLAELKAAETKATKGGDVKSLAAITKEISQVEMGIALPVPPPDLPKLLQTQHRNYYKANEDVDAAIGKQKQQLDAKYLAALAKLQPADGTDSALASQIAEQKKRVISGNFGPITDLQTQLAGTRWQAVWDPNHFEFFGANGRYSNWKYTTPDAETAVVHWDDHSSMTYKLGKDGKTLFKGGVPNLKFAPEKK
jgi:hypothetical protein